MDCVYLTTNLINGKQYIGSHTTNDLSDNYFGSGLLIKKAIKKYGKQNFKKEILEICNTREDAVLLEEVYIKKYDTLIPHGYNISAFGNAAFPGEKNPMFGKNPWNKGKTNVYSPETLQKLSNASKLRGGENHPMYGKCHTEESKNKMSESHKGQTSWLGKHHTEESKNKMSESHKGHIPHNKGQRGVSQKTQEKMKLAKLGKPAPNKGKKFYIDEKGKRKIQK